MGKPFNVKCFACGKECYMPKNRLKTFKYCSRACKDQSNKISIISYCKICNKVFEHISSRCNKAKYCSRLCYHRSQINKGNKKFNCKHCGVEFFDSPSVQRKFCSKTCNGKFERTSWHPKFTTVRKKMLKEGLIDQCEKCGYDEVKEILGIHHIDKNRENNTKENLMVVCPLCHSLLHRKHISH